MNNIKTLETLTNITDRVDDVGRIIIEIAKQLDQIQEQLKGILDDASRCIEDKKEDGAK